MSAGYVGKLLGTAGRSLAFRSESLEVRTGLSDVGEDSSGVSEGRRRLQRSRRVSARLGQCQTKSKKYWVLLELYRKALSFRSELSENGGDLSEVMW